MRILLLTFLFLIVGSDLWGQKKQSVTIDSSESAVTIKTDTTFHDVDESSMETESGIFYFLNQKEFWLAIVVLILLLVILLIEAMLCQT